MTVLAPMSGTADRNQEELLRLWSSVFEIPANPATFLHALGVVSVGPSDLLTARLPFTRRFCSMLEEGQVSMIGVRAGTVRFSDCLEVLAIATTQARVARTRIAAQRAPAVWIRNEDRDNPALPAITLAQLAALCERPEQELKAMLSPLVRDGALRVMNMPGGLPCFLAEPGFAQEGVSRRIMRI